MGSRRLVLACLALGLTCGPAAAEPRLSAVPAFAPLRPDDPACALVTIENDGEARRVVLRGARVETVDAKVSKPWTEMRLDLPPGSRKLVHLPLMPDPQPRGVVALVQDEEVVAVAALDFQWAQDGQPLVASKGPMPPTLAAAARKSLQLPLVEATTLPPNVTAWPRFDALAWDRPRSGDIPPPIAAALRRYVVEGGRLVVGLSHEDAMELDRAGLGDLLPARARPGADLGVELVERDPAARELPVEGASIVERGLGSVVLVPHPLDGVAEDSWKELLAISPPPPDAAKPQPNARWQGWRARGNRGPEPWHRQPAQVPNIWGLYGELVPDPPWIGASLVLLAFLIAAVPLDGWLTRRSLKAGRRNRGGALRYPAIVLAATALSLAIALRASGGELEMVRFDVLDVGADGRGRGTTILVVARGAGGRLAVESEGAGIHELAARSMWRGMEPSASVVQADADPSRPASSGWLEVHPWEPSELRFTWELRDHPELVPGASACDAPDVPSAVALRAIDCHGQASQRRTTAWLDPEAVDVVGSLIESPGGLTLGAQGAPDLVAVLERRLGPPMILDGRDTDGQKTYSLIRRTLPPFPPTTESP